MKKQLSLLTMLALGASVASAAVLDLNLVFDGERSFGYTENQNITIEGFQTKEDSVRSDFLITTPILKDSKDVAVGEYYILLGEKPMSTYVAGDAVTRDDLVELPAFTTWDVEGTFDLTISESMVNTGNTYYGVVVPLDDNVVPGSYSNEFCFNFGTKKYAEADACNSFETPKATESSTLNEALAIEEDDEHGAANGADMEMADISHYIQGNTVTLTWTAVPYSDNVEIRVFDKDAADYVTLGTVPMSQERYQYKTKDTDDELIFAFIPRDAKGREVRYPVNVRHETDVAPTIKNVPATGPVEDFVLMLAITVALYAGYRVFTKKAA
ncbi:hypothetical protein IJU97_06010 [bacterium]|nr:hypothetical protein [bacterium]